jgi:hypothetical protein
VCLCLDRRVRRQPFCMCCAVAHATPLSCRSLRGLQPVREVRLPDGSTWRAPDDEVEASDTAAVIAVLQEAVGQLHERVALP